MSGGPTPREVARGWRYSLISYSSTWEWIEISPLPLVRGGVKYPPSPHTHQGMISRYTDWIYIDNLCRNHNQNAIVFFDLNKFRFHPCDRMVYVNSFVYVFLLNVNH